MSADGFKKHHLPHHLCLPTQPQRDLHCCSWVFFVSSPLHTGIKKVACLAHSVLFVYLHKHFGWEDFKNLLDACWLSATHTTVGSFIHTQCTILLHKHGLCTKNLHHTIICMTSCHDRKLCLMDTLGSKTQQAYLFPIWKIHESLIL